MNSQLSIPEIVSLLKAGGVVVFPTDTVWGIGCALNIPGAIKKLYLIKKREPEKPTALLVADLKMAEQYGTINKQARELAGKHWPGGLTLVVGTKRNKVSKLVLGGTKRVGVRVPNHAPLRQVIEGLGCPLVASSANFAGMTPPLTQGQLDPSLLEAVDGVMEGEAGSQLPSTVVNVLEDSVRVLRQGLVSVQSA